MDGDDAGVELPMDRAQVEPDVPVADLLCLGSLPERALSCRSEQIGDALGDLGCGLEVPATVEAGDLIAALVGQSLRNLRKLVSRRELHARLAECQGDRPISEIARLTDSNHETTRRYLRGISDPVPCFLASFCDVTGTSLEWLMRGVGPRLIADVQAVTLRGCADETLRGIKAPTGSRRHGAEARQGGDPPVYPAVVTRG